MNKYDLEYLKSWRKRNPEKMREYKRRYWEKHKEKIKQQRREKYKKWREKTPYKIKTGWDVVRLKALARDNYTCQVCGNRAREIHHIDGSGSNRPRREQNNNLENLISVCHRCHIGLDFQRLKVNGFFKGKWIEEKERNLEILNLSNKLSQTAISKIYSITRQRVNQIIKRFKMVKVING